MRNTFFKLWVHGIIKTDPNGTAIHLPLEALLHLEIEKRLIEQGCEVAQIGGCSDHVHFLFAQNPLLSIHETFRFVQGITQRWYHSHDFDTGWLKFKWDDGYAAYSVSESNFEKTVLFIKKQKDFHQKYTLIEEIQQLNAWHKVDISDTEMDSELAQWSNRFTFQHLKKQDF